MVIQKTSISIVAGLTAIAVILTTVGFFLPPTGEIHPSVLQACGILFLFSAVWVALLAIYKGTDVTLRKGDNEIIIDNKD